MQEKGLTDILRKQASTFKHARAEYDLKKENNIIILQIKADDISALKATINSIFVTINIYEKAKNI
jgi:tRNA threonylcarbamoyladenosine modification (KEOPS) complex  Pcc1 subunit